MFESLIARLQRHSDGLLLSTVVVLLSGGLFLGLNRPVQEIRVEGSLAAAEQRVVKTALRGFADARILTVSLDAVAQTVAEIDWAQAVTVRRRWPHTLIIGINRQAVVARWGRGEYLTSNGQIVAQHESDGPLPLLVANTVAAPDALKLFQQLRAVSRRAGVRIVELRESASDGWTLTLASGDAVVLGRAEDPAQLAERQARYLTVRNSISAKGPVQADARYAHGVAVKLIEEAEVAVAASDQSPLAALIGEER